MSTHPSPKNRKRPRKDSWSHLVRDVLTGESRLQTMSLCLILCSAADLLMTVALLRRGGRFYESNVAAQWFFARWNVAGMAAFKFTIIGFVIVVSEIVERRRPGLGNLILGIGSVGAVYAFLVGYRLYTG